MPIKSSKHAYTCCPTNKEAGYSLIEMAIGLLILGIVLAGIFHAYGLYMTNERITKTQMIVDNAASRLQTYRHENGFYPCPAPLNADRTDPAYGVPTDCSDTSQAIATCTDGICIEESVRTDMGTKPRVRVGMIPFRALQLDEKEIADAYGSRLLYAVTERQAVIATFQEKEGGVDIIDENGTSQVTPPGSANFIVISHGPNAVGAYNRFGAIQTACAAAVPSLELENCRDFAAPPNDSVYAFSGLSLSGAANNFDDVVQYFVSSETPLWRREDPLSENIVDMSDGNVGVGTASPAQTLTITQSTVATTGANAGSLVNTNKKGAGEHSGALRASANIQADSYCEPNGLNCFQPKNIAGSNASVDPDSGMKCPAGTYMVGIEGNGTDAKPRCAPVRVMCPAATPVLTGLNPTTGAPICSTVLNTCAATVYDLCSPADVSFGVSPHGFLSSQSRGDCRSAVYRCINGTWNVTGPTGACVKSTTTTTATVACGDGYTGTYTTTTNDCDGTTSDWAAVCPATCVGFTEPQSRNCPAPHSGIQNRTVTWTCDASGNLVSDNPPWAPDCGCSLVDDWQTASCPSGYTRTASPNPPSFPATGTAVAENWPASNTEGGYRLNTVALPACNMTNPPYDISNCECDLSPRYGATLKSWTDSCVKAASGGRVNPDGKPVSGYGMGSVPWSHDIIKYDIIPATCTQASTGTIVSPAQSQARVFQWKDQGPIPATPSSTKPAGYPELDDGCTCAQNNTSHALGCVKAEGTVWKYHNCKCLEQ